VNAPIRRFDSGATRDLDASKLDYEGFLSPLVLRRFAEYMHSNRTMADGSVRDSDNWQKGIPEVAYIKSGWRHFFDWWCEHRGVDTKEGIELALCGLLFNAMGYLHEHLKAQAAPVAPHVPDESELPPHANADADDNTGALLGGTVPPP